MKKNLRIFSAAALFLFAACSTDELRISAPKMETEGITEFTVETEAATKTALMGTLSVEWVAGDSIRIFSSNKSAKFYAAVAGKSSGFTAAPDNAATDTTVYFAAAPYGADWKINGDVLTGTIRGYQVAVKGGIDPKYLLMAARSSDTNLSMKNLVALLKISLSDDNVTSVNIVAKGGAKIAGGVTVTLADGADPAIVASTSSVMLAPPAGRTTFEPGDYYVAVAPVAISAGIEALMMNSDDTNVGILTSSNACNLYRSEVMNLGDLCENVSWEKTTTTGMTFHTGSAFIDPIASPTISYGTSFSYTDESKHVPADLKNKVITVVANTENGGMTYKMFAQKGYWKNSSQGFRGFPDLGDYIEFPAFPGLSLKAVKWTFGGAGNNNYPGLATTSNSFVAGGEPVYTNLEVGTPIVWTNLAPEANTAYRVTPDDFGATISCRQFVLYYTGTPEPFVLNVSTSPADNISGTGATIRGSFFQFGSSNIASDYACGFEYKTGGGDWISVNAKAVAASFEADLTGLTPGTEYTFKAWAKPSSGEKVYGGESKFTPSDQVVIRIVSWDYENNTFKNPFTEATKLASSNSKGQNLDTNVVLADESYTLHLHASASEAGASIYSSIHTNTNSGLRFISTGLSSSIAPTYMSLPVVPGKKLKSVILINTGTTSDGVFISSDVTSGTAAASAKLDNKNFGTDKGSQTATVANQLDFTGAVADTQYYLVFGGGTETSKKSNYLAEIDIIFS